MSCPKNPEDLNSQKKETNGKNSATETVGVALAEDPDPDIYWVQVIRLGEDQDHAVDFKMRRNTKMKKMMDCYCDDQDFLRKQVKFFPSGTTTEL